MNFFRTVFLIAIFFAEFDSAQLVPPQSFHAGSERRNREIVLVDDKSRRQTWKIGQKKSGVDGNQQIRKTARQSQEESGGAKKRPARRHLQSKFFGFRRSRYVSRLAPSEVRIFFPSLATSDFNRPSFSSGGFQLSPDFRPRASSNTSSCGRLSPIPAVAELEPDWSTHSPFANPNYSPEMAGNYSPDQLAGNLEQGMKLQPDAYLG